MYEQASDEYLDDGEHGQRGVEYESHVGERVAHHRQRRVHQHRAY